jgi:uncharacterized integral membrane protein
MITRLGKLLVAILLVSATAYLLMRNWTTAEVNLIPGHTFSAPTGVVLLATFILGLLTSTLASSVTSVRATLRERKLQRQLKHFLQNRQQLLEALAAHQEGEHELARSIIQSVVRSTPDDQLARYLVGDMLLQQGDINLAMQAFENQDIAEPLHRALLLKATEVYQKKGNFIGALGSVHTLLRQGDKPKTLALAGELAVYLKKYDEALEYSRRLELLGHSAQELKATIAYQRLVLGEDENRPKKIEPSLIEPLKSLHIQYPSYIPIMVTLGTLLGEYGDKNEAASLLMEVAQREGKGVALLRVVKYWLNRKDGKQAIAAAKLGSTLYSKKEKTAGRNFFGKAVTKEKLIIELSNEDRLLMTFVLALLYLSEGMREEADEALNELSTNTKFILDDLKKVELTSLPYWLLTAVYQSLFGNAPAAYSSLIRGVLGDVSLSQDNLLTTLAITNSTKA